MNDTHDPTLAHRHAPTAEAAEATPAAATAGAEPANDGIDRRNFLGCMAWAGTGLLWTMAGGVPTSKLFAVTPGAAAQASHAAAGFSFVQISDSHIGFNKAANQDVAGTLQLAIDKINAMPGTPDFLLHTGDITQSAKAAEFDTAQQIIRGSRIGDVHYVPGEHDTAMDDGALYLERFGKGTLGTGWYSFDHKGMHFIGLNNSLQVDAMGGPRRRTVELDQEGRPRRFPLPRRSSSSPISRCGWSIRSGAGVRRTAQRRSATSSASAPLPC